MTPARWRWPALLGVCWLLACLGGAFVAMRQEFQPGRLGGSSGWPETASIKPGRSKTTVVAIVHPRCICTAATISHLITVLQPRSDVVVVALIYAPSECASAEGWDEGDHARKIQIQMTSAVIFRDRSGTEARKFGASTSGTILVFDDKGNELFRGGITNRRGGDSDNPGLRHFRNAVERNQRSLAPTPVFGCSLESEVGANYLEGE